MRSLRRILIILALLSAPAFGQALSGVNGDCQIGGQQALTSGLPSTATQQIGTTNVNAGAGVQASFPQCLVSVYLTGTTNKANVYSTNSLIPAVLSNPFVANVDGSFTFFAAAGCYDVVMSSGAGPALPYVRTLSSVCVGQGTVTIPGGSGTVGACGTIGALAFYQVTGTTATCDPLFVTDGSGNLTAVSMTFFGAGAGFVGFEQGTVPPLGAANTAYLYADTSIPATFGTVLPTIPGTLNQVLGITSVVDATHIKTGWIPVGVNGIIGSPNSGIQVTGDGINFVTQTKPIYDTRDWMTCDGTTDASSGMRQLLSTIGTAEAAIHVIGQCRIGNTFFKSNITLDFSGGGSLKLISSTTPPGGASFVNGTSVECGSGVSCSAPALAVTDGNTIVVSEAPYPGFGSSKTTSVTDSCGNFYIHVFQSLVNQPRNQGAWVASSASAGSCTVTATANTSLTTHMMIVSQWAGMGPVASLDTSASSNTVANPMSSGAMTPAAGSLLIAFGGQPFATETCTAGSGFIQPAGIVGQTTNGYMCLEYQLSAAGTSVTATQNITSLPANLVYSMIALKPGNATATIWGGIVNPDQHQIFYNADSQIGHGVVDFTGSNITQDVYPEWWGASPVATGTVNTPAIQAAIWAAFGGGLTQARTNASGLSIYNRSLRIGALYVINDELKMYDVLGFQVKGVNRLSSGFSQSASNKRIIDGQSVAYGKFTDLSFNSTASSTLPQVDIDYNGVTTAGDLAPQFVDFDRVNWIGNTLAAQGLLLAKSGSGAQGSNIYCHDCAAQNFTVAAWQIGTASNLATNALAIGFSGDIQGCPAGGILDYGGGYISFGNGVEESTMENGFSTQTGFDMQCVLSQGPCSMDYMRSESRRLISGNDIVLHKSRMINQASYLPPGTTFPVGSLMTGSGVGGDGAFYTVTNNSSAAGGIGTPSAPLRASSGTGTTLVDTNQTVAGAVTIGLFGLTANEVVTQAVTGSTGTVLGAPASIGTVTGTNTSGQFVLGETATQAGTGITAVVQAPTPNLSNPTLPLKMNNFSGTANSSGVWTGGTSGATYTPTSVPSFSASSMLITAATGSPDSTHTWTGGSNGGVFTPTGSPVNQASFGTNAFTGMLVSVLSGKNGGCYGTVTSNTATSITLSAGWTTRYAKLGCPFPDTTSSFVVEPGWNHGTVTSGGMTMVYLDENAIDCQTVVGVRGGCTPIGRLEDVIIAGGQVRASAGLRIDDLLVYRQDWFDNAGGQDPQQCCDQTIDWAVRIASTVALVTPPYQGTFYQSWNLPSLTGVSYSGGLQERLGTKALVWDIGNIGSNNLPPNTSANSVWIGGRTDSGAGADASRNILEFGGMLGRGAPLPSAANSFNTTNQPGLDTDFIGGPSTGTAAGGAINFWISVPGSSGSAVNSATKRASIDSTGWHPPQLAFANLGTPSDGTIVFCTDCKNVADDTTGTFDSTAASGGHGTTVLRENGAWRVH